MKLVKATPKVPRYCSFCGREECEVEVLLAGPASNFICDGCVSDCVAIIAEKRIERAATLVVL